MTDAIPEARQASLPHRDPAVSASAGYSIRAVERTLDILDVLARSPDGLSLARLAEAVGLPKSSVFRYVAVLESRRYVARDAQTGNYSLGLALFSFQTPPLGVLGARARPWLETLRDEFEETINLGVLDGSRVVYLEVMESPKAMRLSARRGDHDFIHASAIGKAIAAQLDDDDVMRILEIEGLPRLTSQTITDASTYMRALSEIRGLGYATDYGEAEEGACCVAIGIPLEAIAIPAAISLSSPATRFPEDRAISRVAERLAEAARGIASSLDPEPLRAP
jgi:IclR family transcriptional regulator, acetate operon repressor